MIFVHIYEKKILFVEMGETRVHDTDPNILDVTWSICYVITGHFCNINSYEITY